jgi:hypothetical protein
MFKRPKRPKRNGAWAILNAVWAVFLSVSELGRFQLPTRHEPTSALQPPLFSTPAWPPPSPSLPGARRHPGRSRRSTGPPPREARPPRSFPPRPVVALTVELSAGALPLPRPQAGALPQDPRQGGASAQGCSSGVQRARPPSCLPPGGRSSFLLRGNALPQDPTQYLVFHEIVTFHPSQKQLFFLSNRRPYIIYTSMQLKKLDNPSNIRSLEASTNWHLAFYHHFKC